MQKKKQEFLKGQEKWRTPTCTPIEWSKLPRSIYYSSRNVDKPVPSYREHITEENIPYSESCDDFKSIMDFSS
jgi:hypothetical protein